MLAVLPGQSSVLRVEAVGTAALRKFGLVLFGRTVRMEADADPVGSEGDRVLPRFPIRIVQIGIVQSPEIYNRVYEREFEMKKDAEKIQREIDLLKSVCENPLDFDLIQELLIMQKNKALLNRKRGLKDDMERVIEKYIKKATA